MSKRSRRRNTNAKPAKHSACLACGHHRGCRTLICSPCDKFLSKVRHHGHQSLQCVRRASGHEGGDRCPPSAFRRFQGSQYCSKCRYDACKAIRTKEYGSLLQQDSSEQSAQPTSTTSLSLQPSTLDQEPPIRPGENPRLSEQASDERQEAGRRSASVCQLSCL